MPGVFSGVRWREDVGWELRCEGCFLKGQGTTYWPLTFEFWEPRNMKRCRACHKDYQAARKKAKYRADAAYRDHQIGKTRAWRAANPVAVKEHARSRWARLIANPKLLAEHAERQRERQRLYKQRQRALARQREAAA